MAEFAGKPSVYSRMASCLGLLVRLAFVAFTVDNLVRSLELEDARTDAGLANETSGGADREYEIEIQFNPQHGKIAIQSARKIFKYLKKWKKSYKAEVELAECFAGYLTEKFLRQRPGPCTKNDEHAESRVYMSKMRFGKQDEVSERLNQESNLILDFDEGNLMHVSDGEKVTGWASHPGGSGNNIYGWEEEETKHFLHLLRGKVASCEFKRAVAELLHKIYLLSTSFISKNLLLACVAKYLLKKFWKWVDLSP